MRVRNRTIRNAINRLSLAMGLAPVAYAAVPDDVRVLFHKRDREDFGFLSNFHEAAIEIDGERWPTVEHYYQAQKSHDPDYRKAVCQARTPGQAKRLGDVRIGSQRQATCSWFRTHPETLRPDWDEVKLAVMESAVEAKFRQNEDLARALLATGDALLVEDSRRDNFWGAGRKGAGQNWLGRVLMDVRERLRADRSSRGWRKRQHGKANGS
ncbi:MAG: NADAR family protein [Planctomycetota bacterium]